MTEASGSTLTGEHPTGYFVYDKTGTFLSNSAATLPRHLSWQEISSPRRLKPNRHTLTMWPTLELTVLIHSGMVSRITWKVV